MGSMNSRLYLNKRQSTPSKTTNIQNINQENAEGWQGSEPNHKPIAFIPESMPIQKTF